MSKDQQALATAKGNRKMPTQMTWIDVMGLPVQYIETYVYGEHVYVDEDNLGTMESSVLMAELTDDESTQEYAAAIRNTPRDTHSALFDVTEVGGGWSNWEQMIAE